MKIGTTIVLVIVLVMITLFFLLPILSGNIPEDMSATEIGHFIGGFSGYWREALKSVFSAL